VSGDPDRSEVRLAELVAALSLGIDLGFAQPMEHVLRQCLIALRLGERLGASGRWPELRAEFAALYERDEPLDYLVALGRKDER
jgi:hypothetical protein